MSSYFLRSYAVSKNMFQDDEEMLQWDVVRVKLTAELEAALNDLRIERMNGQDSLCINKVGLTKVLIWLRG